MTHNEYRDNLRAQIRDCSFGGDNYMPEISIWSRFIDLEMVHGYDLREKWEQDA